MAVKNIEYIWSVLFFCFPVRIRVDRERLEIHSGGNLVRPRDEYCVQVCVLSAVLEKFVSLTGCGMTSSYSVSVTSLTKAANCLFVLLLIVGRSPSLTSTFVAWRSGKRASTVVWAWGGDSSLLAASREVCALTEASLSFFSSSPPIGLSV